MTEMKWLPISDKGPWDGQPYRQWVRIEGSREHSGVTWARVYCGEAFLRAPHSEDHMLGYRFEDIARLCELGDIDIETAKVTHWMPVIFPRVQEDAALKHPTASREMTEKKDRGAVLQFEIDRKRWLGVADRDIATNGIAESQIHRLHHIARTAISDTIRNGGTFVLVAGKDKITMVQRAELDDEDDAALTTSQRGTE